MSYVSDATACYLCKGKCCKKLPVATAEEFEREVRANNPELLQLMTGIITPNTKGQTVCPFLSLDEGCVLEKECRPYRCGEFECDLFQLIAQDPDMVQTCMLHIKTVLMPDPCSGNYKILCGPDCPRKTHCIVPRENRSDLSR
ncbi:MAG: hypothetical protein WCP93_03205 [Candidatus Berkelbacteria bacterium]